MFQSPQFDQPAHLEPQPPQPAQPDLSRPFEHAHPSTFAAHVIAAAHLLEDQNQYPNTKPRYKNVNVLTMRWEQGDAGTEQAVQAVHNVFRDRYNFTVEDWQIPSSANPSVNISARLAKFLEYDDPETLLIIFYAGHGYISSAVGGSQTYWARYVNRS
jgi:hypothetical protein